MRDAFGGTFVIKLIIIFIVLYVSFMAVAMQYAKTFRVKNLIINKLEQSQYNGTSSDDYVLDEIADSLGKIPYNVTEKPEDCQEYNDFKNSEDYGTGTAGGGYCLEKKGEEGKHYYKVTTYITASLPLFKIVITIPISGETKIIYE